MYLDNNSNVCISNKCLQYYNKGAKFGNIYAKTEFADEGKDIIMKFKNYILAEHGSNYHVIITSGGSESNSHAIFNILYKNKFHNLRFLCSTVEHPSITEYMKQLQHDGIATVKWVTPATNGKVDQLEFVNIAKEFMPHCAFLQSANSETGCMQNILFVYNKLQELGIPMHVDNVQGFMKMKYPKNTGDTIAISLHKIGSPLGIGALLFKKNFHMNTMIAGKQNGGFRGGTYNIGAIYASVYCMSVYEYSGMKLAKIFFLNELNKYYPLMNYNEFTKLKPNSIDTYAVIYSDIECLPHTILLSLVKDNTVICGKKMQHYLYEHGYTVGTGSACNSKNKSESDNLGSMQSSAIDKNLKTGFLRFSLCTDTKCDSRIAKLCKLMSQYEPE